MDNDHGLVDQGKLKLAISVSLSPFGGHDHALLSTTTPILLWRRSARKDHVPVHPRPNRADRLRQEPALLPRRLLAGGHAVPRRPGRLLRLPVFLVLAG